MATGALVMLAVIPPPTTPKTGAVHTDGETNPTSQDHTSRQPIDGWKPTRKPPVAGSRPAGPTSLQQELRSSPWASGCSVLTTSDVRWLSVGRGLLVLPGLRGTSGATNRREDADKPAGNGGKDRGE
jgi:hypothetical protein